MRLNSACTLAVALALAWSPPARAEPVGAAVRYDAAPGWIKPAPPALTRQPSSGAADVAYNDTQVKIASDTVEAYQTYRIRLLRSEALALGNINLAWNPDTTAVTVHRLLVHRDGQAIDVLKTAKFSVFQREGRLEQAMLDGMLTASLQIPGLRVGDEIEFAATTAESTAAFPGKVFGAMAIPGDLPPGTFRMALQWAPARPLRWQASKDLEPLLAKQPNAVAVTLTDAARVVAPAGAPPRYAIARLVEYTGFADWQAVSASFDALFAKASQLPDDETLTREIERIAAAGPGKRQRALGALELVQDSIRYVYTGMDGGNYRPASVAQTWERRFGDCKGKTAMLLGILRKLGIEAEAVLVNSAGGDGLDQRLPNPGLFDHVLVRASIDGESLWLDGTRSGEGRLLPDAEIGASWVLPLSAQGKPLEARAYVPPRQPSEITFIDIDASGGIDAKAQVTATRILRGDPALIVNQALQAQSKESAEASLREQAADGWIDPQSAEWRYDRAAGALTIKIKGPATLDWEKQSGAGKPATASFFLPGGGFFQPAKLERPSEQDKTAPYANVAGSFKCSVTRMKLPATAGQHWTLTAPPMDRVVGGVAYYRTANLDRGVVSLVRSTRTLQTELTTAQAIAANRLIPGFDHQKTWVESAVGPGESTHISDTRLPDVGTVDWAGNGALCRSPTRD